MNSTAVLIFANTAGVDAARKGIPRANALFTCLNEEIVAKVERTGLPYFLYTEELQTGSNFGARFTAAIQSVFSKGYDRIITVGNDTPNLTVATLIETYECLVQGKSVIGPSTDGGMYLLGIHKNRFDPIRFQKLPWQKSNLFQETSRIFQKGGRLHQLPRLTDIDNLGDIKTLIIRGNSISQRVLRLLFNLLEKKKRKFGHLSHSQSSSFFEMPFNKGSPSFLPL